MLRLIILSLLLSACSITGENFRYAKLLKFNEQFQFKETILKGKTFDLFSMQKLNGSKSLVVYIEGDGLSWVNRVTPSSDPTPINPVGFKLARIDLSKADIVYLARPCQYVKNQACNKDVWARRQYAREIINDYINIIEELSSSYEDLHIVGYSGGAALARFLGSVEKLKVKSIRTIAGNIEPNEFVRLLNLTPHESSVDFNNVDQNIKQISQTHYYGLDDKVIPLQMHQSYERRHGDNECIKVIAVKATHEENWERFWQNNYALSLNC